jgi:hypothetical protein
VARINKALLDIKEGNAGFRGSQKAVGDGAASHSRPSQFEAVETSEPRSMQSASPEVPSISFETIHVYLNAYADKMYAVWPVVNADALTADIGASQSEALALAFSVCAATGVQLRLDEHGRVPGWRQIGATDHFADEAERVRKALDSRENPSLTSILIPFFLHIYNYGRNKKVAAALCLREALTLCEILHLDKEDTYETLPYAEQVQRRKIFWLLFVTERGMGMLSRRTVLRPDIGLPSVQDDKDPTQFAAFLKLVELFLAVDDPIFGSGSKYASQMLTKERLVCLQRQLSVDASALSTNDVQRTDLAITQQWYVFNSDW